MLLAKLLSHHVRKSCNSYVIGVIKTLLEVASIKSIKILLINGCNNMILAAKPVQKLMAIAVLNFNEATQNKLFV